MGSELTKYCYFCRVSNWQNIFKAIYSSLTCIADLRRTGVPTGFQVAFFATQIS
jgi:hypothetical protein